MSSQYSPVVVALPYSTNIASVKIVMGDKLIYSVSPKSKVLEDAIKNIPDLEFKTCYRLDSVPFAKAKENAIRMCGSHSKDLLLVHVKIVADLIKKGQFRQARKALELLRFEVDKILLDHYAISNINDTTKEQLISILDKLIQEL